MSDETRVRRHVPYQIGTHDREGWRTREVPSDVCLGCSDPCAGRWVPVNDCPDAYDDLAAEPSECLESRVVAAVLRDLRDRSGFDHWWGVLDEDVQLDVVTELETTVCALLEEAGL